MPTDLQARAPLDDIVVDAVSKLKTERGPKGAVELLTGRGLSFINTKTLYNIEHKLQDTVPYELYLELAGKKKAEEIPWEEIEFTDSIDLARKIAYWHCFFFDVGKHDFAEQVVEQAKIHGLNYTSDTMETRLFFTSKSKRVQAKRVKPVITEIVAQIFNTAASGSNPYSHNEIEDLVNYFDSLHNGERDHNKVSWNVVGPVLDALIGLTNKSFYAIMSPIIGNSVRRRRFEREEGSKVSIKQYSELLRELQAHPMYRGVKDLVEVLNGIDILQSAIARATPLDYVSAVSGLTREELRLIKEGNQIYGDTFMQHIFPEYIAIKHEHGFPTKYFAWVVGFPNSKRIVRNYRTPDEISMAPLDVIARAVGESLSYYKGILETNSNNGHQIGISRDGMVQRLREAGEDVVKYVLRQPSHLRDYRNSLRLPAAAK